MKLTEFNEGGLHHQNPNGGIPVGGNNTVEQGETKIGNFVYSNRLFIDENLPKEMNLPNYIKNKSFADASKAIDNKFKDRNDKPSLETKKALLERLANAQEILKQQKEQEANKINEALKINSTQTPDMMNGRVPQGMEQFVQGQNQMFLGGLFGKGELGNITGGGLGLAEAAGPGALMGGLSLANLSQGVGASTNRNVTAMNGVMQGVQAGSAFGPVGMGFGALAGLSVGILGGQAAQREQARITKRNAINYNKGVSGDYAYGGKINMLSNGGYYNENNPYFTTNPGQIFKGNEGTLNDKTLTQNLANQYLTSKTNNWYTKNSPYFSIDKTNEIVSSNSKNSIITPKKDYSQVGNDLLRMSPVLSNFMQLKGMKAPKAVSYAPLRNTLKYDPIDEARQEKIISQEANKQLGAITQAGGSQGAFRNAITSVGLNSMLARNAAAMNTESQNREQRLKIQDNQQRVNEYNNQMQNKAIDERRMDLGNYDTQKSKFIGQIGSDLGEIGKEQTFKKQAEKITGYSWMGDFLNKNPNYKAQFDAIMKDPSLDDNTKRAKAKALADSVYKGFNPEQINLANNSASLVGSYGLPTKK